MRTRWQAGQTTTEYLMISGIMTAITIILLRFVFSASCVGAGPEPPTTIQCILQDMADRIINDPDGESGPPSALQCGFVPGPCAGG